MRRSSTPRIRVETLKVPGWGPGTRSKGISTTERIRAPCGARMVLTTPLDGVNHTSIPPLRARTLYWRSDVPTPWMRFVIRAPVGERLVSFCSEIGAESVSDGPAALLPAWKEVARAEVRTDA